MLFIIPILACWYFGLRYIIIPFIRYLSSIINPNAETVKVEDEKMRELKKINANLLKRLEDV